MFGKSKLLLEPIQMELKKKVSSAEAALNWQVENVVAQNQALLNILDNQQKLAEAET